MGDNAEESDRQLPQFLGAMRYICIEKQGIPRCERVNLVPVPVSDLTIEHIKKFDAFVLEHRKHVRRLCKRYEIGLHEKRPVPRVPKELILMPGPRAASLDL
jgi:hypothetical protein